MIGSLLICDRVRGQAADKPDSTGNGEMFLAPDTLTARYADSVSKGPGSTVPGLRARAVYSRTVLPLDHAGQNVYQALLDDPRLLSVLRFLKDNSSWNPLQDGLSSAGDPPYDYDRDGAIRNSHRLSLGVERPLLPGNSVGFQLDSRLFQTNGPFPNQQTNRLDVLTALNIRLSSNRRLSVSLLGLDSGWLRGSGNRVYTDRARYILESLNRWQTLTGGVAATYEERNESGLSYRLSGELVSERWRTTPPAGPASSAATNVSESFLDGVLPARPGPEFTASRRYTSFNLSTSATYTLNTNHTVGAIAEVRIVKLGQRQTWQGGTRPSSFNLDVRPRSLSFAITDQLRFGALLMALKVKYERLVFSGAPWGDVYQTIGDDHAIAEPLRLLVLATGDLARPVNLLSPRIDISYPSETWNAHMSFGVTDRQLSLNDRFRVNGGGASRFADRSVTELHPSRKTTLEGGVGRAGRTYTFDVTGFYRDSERYAPVFGPEALPQEASNYGGYWGRVNWGFRRQAGFEVTAVRRLGYINGTRARVNARMSYTYLKNLGTVAPTDSPLGPGDPLSPGDFTTFSRHLNAFWNRRHWLAVNGTMLFNNGAALSGAAHLQSGVPYRGSLSTKVGDTARPVQDGAIGFGPWRRSIDTRLDVPLPRLTFGPGVGLFVEIRNVLNDVNVDLVADSREFEEAGQPDNSILDQAQRVYGPARSVWAGVNLEW